MPESRQRTDTVEHIEIVTEGSPHSVCVTRKRNEEHTSGQIHDICIITRRPGASMAAVIEIPAETEREFIQALIDAHQKRSRWELEGLNWSLADGV